MLNSILDAAPNFLLCYARCIAMILTLPFFSMRTVSRRAKLVLSGYMAFLIFPKVDFSIYALYISDNQAFSLEFIMLVLGEALIGILIGFFVSIIFAAFSTAGQFFAFQMGFSAASAYDALSQVENPLMGQYLNLIAMLVFMQTHWFQKLFITGLQGSYASFNAFTFASQHQAILAFLIKGLSNLFMDALIISLPVMGTLLLVTVTTGLLSKAAPQMNLLSEGFPIMILLSFFILTAMLPAMCNFFVNSFRSGISDLTGFFASFVGVK